MKKIISFVLLSVFAFGLVACTDNPGEEKPNGGGNEEIEITETYEGTINFCIPFGADLPAYEKLVEEYNKYQPNVTVKLKNESTETYSSILQNDILQPYSESSINIFSGNYVSALVNDAAVDLYPYILRPNQYTGARWRDCLQTAAYISPGTTNTTKMMATNIISVAWYYNKTATTAAGVNAEEIKTWDDLLNACKTMQEAGYMHPMGVSVADQSYRGSQLSWLFRVYGDQYYRDLYDLIQAQEGDYCYDASLEEFVYAEDMPQPEDEPGWNMNTLRMQKLMLDKEDPNYAGPTSERYRELYANILKMSPYLQPDVLTTSDDLTGKFVAGGKTDPVFYIDVLGFGSKFTSLIKDSSNPFELGVFNFPVMEAEATQTRILRSLGGNSAWLAVRETKNKQTNAMCIDFVQYFMSPVGQEVFIEALIENDSSLSGPSTVIGVSYPEEWDEIYNNPELEKNGLCDRNQYLTYLIIPFEVFSKGESTKMYNLFVEQVQNGGTPTDQFFEEYYTIIYNETERLNQTKAYSRAEAWKTPEISPI